MYQPNVSAIANTSSQKASILEEGLGSAITIFF